jgi:endonuclease YncB( thermonuclease family)
MNHRLLIASVVALLVSSCSNNKTSPTSDSAQPPLTQSAGPSFAKNELSWRGTVVDVYDGDTFRVRMDDRVLVLLIRLGRIDCPELGQPYADAARRRTLALVRDEAVHITITDTKVTRDSGWFRGAVAGVRLADGRDLAAELARGGLAWADLATWPEDKVADLEQEARAGRRGLWRQAKPESPWHYRAQHPRPRLRVPHPTQFDDLTLPPYAAAPPTVGSVPP